MPNLYLLKEAGAFLAGGAIAGAFSGGASSPPYMPRLPWNSFYRNVPGPLATPPIMTRIPPGTLAPPSAYDIRGEAGMLSEAGMLRQAGMLDEAGSPVPGGTGLSQAQWDALTPSAQQGVLSELGARAATTGPTMTTAQARRNPNMTMAIAPAPSAPPAACPPGYVNIGGGEFPNNCVPAHTVSPPPATQTPPTTEALPPPAFIPPSAPVPPSMLPPSGGGGGAPVPWGPILVGGGVVLAFLYAGRRKKKRR